MCDFTSDLPTGDLQLGPKNSIRTYGFPDIDPPLVEMRVEHRGDISTVRLTVEQADLLAAALMKAAQRARRR